MAGGAGVEYYFGYRHSNSDLTCQDYRSRARMFTYSRYALEFFKNNDIPFWNMYNDDQLVVGGDNWCLTDGQDYYVIYLQNGGSTRIGFLPAGADFEVTWYRAFDGFYGIGSVTSVSPGSNIAVGSHPQQSGKDDWVVLLRRGPNQQPIAPPPPPPPPTRSPVLPATPSPVLPATLPPVGQFPFGVTGFTLLDAANDVELGPLGSGYELSAVGTKFLAIRAEVRGINYIGSVCFQFTGQIEWIENVAPYVLGGDVEDDIEPFGPLGKVGVYQLRATPYSGRKCRGEAGEDLFAVFTVFQ